MLVKTNQRNTPLMGNKASTIPEQIKLLQDRGMIISDEDKAGEVLLDVGYYRLGFYWFPFEVSYPKKEQRKHLFRKGTKFDYIVKLYYFDFNLRTILMKYLNRIEINFRTFLTYHVSNLHPNSTTWFVDPAIVTSDFIDSFDKEVYTKKFKLNPMIKQHHQNHINDRYAPAWKTIEFMTLGQVIYLFHSIKSQTTKCEICRQFGIKRQKVFDSYLSIIRTVRNRCAHGNILYDTSLPVSIRKGPAGQMFPTDYQKLNGAIKVIYYMIGCISTNRQEDLRKDLKKLLLEYSTVPEVWEIIKNATGIRNVDITLA